MNFPPKHILLVEDEASVRSALRFMLRTDEHTVEEAANGAQALDLLSKHRFDLVMTDFAMPGMNGAELAVKIKQLVPGQPILIITGYRKAPGDFQSYVDAILLKPFSLEELRQTLLKLFN
jgi:CheY-like chemotaxis protein